MWPAVYWFQGPKLCPENFQNFLAKILVLLSVIVCTILTISRQ